MLGNVGDVTSSYEEESFSFSLSLEWSLSCTVWSVCDLEVIRLFPVLLSDAAEAVVLLKLIELDGLDGLG